MKISEKWANVYRCQFGGQAVDADGISIEEEMTFLKLGEETVAASYSGTLFTRGRALNKDASSSEVPE